MNNMEIATTILQQLGGNKFKAMTGAKDFLALDPGLQFDLPRKLGYVRSGINRIEIKLRDDLYDVRFLKLKRTGPRYAPIIVCEVLGEAQGVYCDLLKRTFEVNTGLRTGL